MALFSPRSQTHELVLQRSVEPTTQSRHSVGRRVGWLRKGCRSLGGGTVVRFSRIWMSSGECRLNALAKALANRVFFTDTGQIIEDIEPEKLFNSLLNERIQFILS